MAGERDKDIEQSLPWLANETLQGEEARAAETLAKESSMAAQDLEFMRGLRAQMKTMEAGNSPGALGWRRLQQQIARERRGAGGGTGWRNIAAIAAAVVILLQAGMALGLIKDCIQIMDEVEAPARDAYFVYPEELRNSKRINVFRDFLLRKVADWQC